MTVAKIIAARARLLKELNSTRSSGQQLSSKNLDALLELQERYVESRKGLRANHRYEPIACDCKLDRTVLTTPNHPRGVLEQLGYAKRSHTTLWDRVYRSVDRYQGTNSIRAMNIEYEPTVRWAPGARISTVPCDAKGTKTSDLLSIWERIAELDLQLLEVAFDFDLDTPIDVDFVRAHLVSGKMRLQPGSDRFHERFPGASRTIRAYVKWELPALRLEFEIHSRMLRKEGVKDPFDFRRLAERLIPTYVFFARLDRMKVAASLKRHGLSARRQNEINRSLDALSKSMWASLRYLRRDVGLKNTRRLLTPLGEINSAMAEAVRKWAAAFPTSPQLQRR